ncbi:DNA phosphorothioation-associated protein 4 [Bradyrhizobium sp. USDA 4451]
MMGRIAPPKALEDDLERFVMVDPQDGVALFETKQKALMFAAALGKWRGQERSRIERKGVAIRYDVFETRLDDGYIDALAVSETGDLRVLSSERDDERIAIFEEYAQAGLREMIECCFHRPGDPMEALLALIDEARVARTRGVEGIDEDALRQLMGD